MLLSRRSMVALAVPFLGRAQGSKQFSDRLWGAISTIYAETLRHPFLTGLTDGSLSKERFEFYLKQDSLYLVAFAEALGVLASKSPRVDWMITLNQHAIDSVKTEKQLHESILRGASARTMAPVNYAYSNHFLATVHRKPFAEGLCAMLPCYWIYWEAGKVLVKRGSKNREYQQWIDQYSSEDYGKSVREVLAMMDAMAQEMTAAQRERCLALFERGARYEWMFWDMAWRKESWPPQ